MPTTTIFCPACNHKLRVPDELMAQPVQCPKCGSTFTAPPPMSPAGTTAPESEQARLQRAQQARAPRPPDYDDDYPPRGHYWEEEGHQTASVGKVAVPAVFLMIIAALGMLSSLARIIMGLFLPKIVEQLQDNQAQLFGQPPANINMRVVHVVAGSVFGLLSLITFLGGIAMIRKQFYALAIAGCVTAMLNLSDGCCLLGLPVGIWALVTLLQPDVKASFS